MIIEDRPNLERIRRALDAYTTTLSERALRSSDQQVKDYYDPEIDRTLELIKAVDTNLFRIKDTNEHGG
jgi:hypothetical protein